MPRGSQKEKKGRTGSSVIQDEFSHHESQADNDLPEATSVTTIMDLPKDPGNKDIPAKLGYLCIMLMKVLTLLGDLKDSLECSQKDVSELKSKVSQVEKIANDAKSDTNKLQHELNTLKQQHKKLEEKVINIESQSRRNNLLLDGIPEADNESSKDCFDKVYDILKQKLRITNSSQIKIVQCHRLGRSTPNSTRPRTIILKLHWFGDLSH